MELKSKIREIDNFPVQGVSFKDITTLLKDGQAYQAAINLMKEIATPLQADLIAGPEARGFVVGAPLAYAMGTGFIPIRKSGKLPADTFEAHYSLEYGQDKLAMHRDAIKPGQRILIADDLLATGGTISSTIDLIEQCGGVIVGAIFLIELSYLNGRSKLKDLDVYSLITY